MSTSRYDRNDTALLVIDPYNDFISEGGKVWERLRGVAEGNDCIPHMRTILTAARNAQLRVFYALHRRYRAGDDESWKYMAPVQKAAWSHKTFEYGSWGGEIRSEFAPQPDDVVALEHWCSSGFANTDLDLGYDVTMVKDATADYSDDAMHAALDVNIPNYASSVLTTSELVESLAALVANDAR